MASQPSPGLIPPTPETQPHPEKPSTTAPTAERHTATASRGWQIISLLLPVLLTGWLTSVISRSETRVTAQLDLQKQLFAQQVQLSEDLYKRRFETYDKLYAELITLSSSIERLDAGGSRVVWNRRLTDSLAQLDTLRKTNRLHMSDSVYKTMGDAWQKGVRMNARDLDQVEFQMDTEMKELMKVDASLTKESTAIKPANSSQPN